MQPLTQGGTGMRVYDIKHPLERWYHVKVYFEMAPWEGWAPYLKERPVA